MSEPSLLKPSKAKIARLLSAQARTAGEVASSLQIQPSAARKHLEELVGQGLVVEEFRKANVGRPKKFYALTEKGREMFPRQYEMVLDKLVSKLVEARGEAYTESLMKQIARDISETVDGAASTGATHVNNVLAELNRVGFEATIRRANSGFTVVSRNCPLYKTAMLHQEVICRGMHEELLKAMLGARSVERTDWIVAGDGYCNHAVSK